MASFACTGIPNCTIDFSLEIHPEEIAPLTESINTLLKSSYLIGMSGDTEATFSSIFDIAEEIAGVEACGFLRTQDIAPDSWELAVSRRIESSPLPEQLPQLVAPAAIAAHFGRGISMDPEWGPWSAPICEAWSSRSLVSFPLRRDRDIVGAIVFGKRKSHPFLNAQVKLLWALAIQAESYLLRSEMANTFSFYAFLDPLTHLNNRRYFDVQLEKEILRARRSGKSLGLLLLDLDGFKAYNDRYLNNAGNIVLQEFADILGGCVREVDTVARVEDDEFAVILVESNAEGAQALANRIIERFRMHLLPGAGETRTERLSVSVGGASFPADSFDRGDLVSKANRALAFAKSVGGGRACLFHEAIDQGTDKSTSQDLPIRTIFDASRSVIDMDKFLEILLFTGMQALGATRGSIVVKDPEGDFTLRTAIGFGRHEELLTTAPSIQAGPITSWVVEHQVPLIVSQPDDSPVTLSKRKNGYHNGSFLSIPLIHTGRTLGALHLTNRRESKPFTREDLKTFAPVASEIAAILFQGMEFRENVRSFTLSILGSLSNALELRFPFLRGHPARVRDIAVRMGERIGLDPEDLETLRTAAGLHDVGIVGIPGNILSKKRRLNDSELEIARKAPIVGARLLEGVPGMDAARRTILEYHENYDGSGYPSGIRGEDIFLPARILRLAEYYDSIISERPHRRGLQPAEALQLIRTNSNTLFDPDIARIFVDSHNPGMGALPTSNQ